MPRLTRLLQLDQLNGQLTEPPFCLLQLRQIAVVDTDLPREQEQFLNALRIGHRQRSLRVQFAQLGGHIGPDYLAGSIPRAWETSLTPTLADRLLATYT